MKKKGMGFSLSNPEHLDTWNPIVHNGYEKALLSCHNETNIFGLM